LLDSANVGEGREAPRIPADGGQHHDHIGDPTAGTIHIAIANAKTA
jgi:hypothetical protein